MKSLRRILIQELVVILGLLGALLGLLLWIGMGRVLDLQMEARASEGLLRLERDLQVQLRQASHLGGVTERLWLEGQVDPDQPLLSGTQLLTLMEGFPGVTSLVLVNAEGHGVVVNRDREGRTQARGIRSTEDRTREFPLGNLSREAWDTWLPMRLSERPWFKAAEVNPEPRWVEVYPFLSSPAHGLSFVVPLRGPGRIFRGAVCVDVLLETLSTRVWETRPTPGSLTLVCDAQLRSLILPREAAAAQTAYLEPVGPAFLPLFDQLLSRWKDKGGPTHNLPLRHEGSTYLGRVQPFVLDAHSTWFLCLAVPLADYRGAGFQITLSSVGLSLLGLGLLAWRLHRVARRIDTPLAALAGAAQALGRGEAPDPLPDSPLAEVQALNTALARAGEALETEIGLQRQLQQSQRLEAVGTLAGGVAHDVNNQLAAIVGQLNLLREQLPDAHPGRVRLERAEQAADRCAQMIRSLLGFARGAQPELKPLDLNGVLRNAALLLERLLGGQIRLDLSLASALPMIRGDSAALEQVVMNLAINARDAMPQGGRLILGTHAIPELGQVRLFVQDTGTGISPADLERIFDPFFTTKEVGKGTGLGLAMVFGIVRSHQGSISVDSTLGEGSTFRLDFPILALPIPAESPAPAPEPDTVDFAGKRILVVDDEPELRDLMADAFLDQRAQVDTAANGDLAWRLVQQGPPYDLVISDQRMPECTGLDLRERIRTRHPHLPMILVSGYGLEEAEATLRQDPWLRLLSKPFSFRKLFETAGELLSAQGNSGEGPRVG